MSISPTGSVHVVPPFQALSQINGVVGQLQQAGLTPQREAGLEQQLVKIVSSANPSANWAMIATIANDLSQQSVPAAATIDVQALDRMVVPTTASSLSATIGGIAQQLRGQSPFPVGVTILSATASAHANTVTLPSTTGVFTGDTVQIKLDNGQSFSTKITNVASGIVTLSTRLPGQASAGNLFTNTTQQARSQTATSSATSGAIVTTLNAAAAAGTSTVMVTSAAGMFTGDAVQLQLLDGSTLLTTITGITGSTTLTADALANSNTVALSNVTGLHNGDTVHIKLDDGSTFNTIIGSIAGNTVTIAAPLPSQASLGSIFTDPTNIAVTLQMPLPVAALSGNSLTDTANVPPSTTTIAVTTTLTAPAAAQATSLTVASGGLIVGDPLQIQLANGSVFNTQIANILGSTVTIASPLPTGALSGGLVTDTVDLAANMLIGAANPTADTNTLQTLESNLLSATLTTTQYQQDVAGLVKLAKQGIVPGTPLNIIA
jgi:hypothetical protein